MATPQNELKVNLSEELSSKEKENGSISCEEKIAVVEDNIDTESCSNKMNLDRIDDANELLKNAESEFLECTDKNMFDQKCEGEKNSSIGSAVSGAVRTGEDCCSNTGSVEDNDLDKIRKNNQVSMSRDRKVNETLLEEDEIGCSGDEQEHYESAEEEHLTPEEAKERMNEALELKKEGNDHFRKQEYFEGKELYTKAIKRCPKEFTENRSIFYANRAACFQKLEDYENAISDCSSALELSPSYVKARLRRAQCYEQVEKLEEALEDYKIVFESDKSCQPAREAIMRLPEEIKIKHEKLKEEMIGKLKDLGNMVLRPFGLSTDNFKLQQDPNSGGYSINFQK
ncbi:tetratricopeptide repeat protein 1-like [Dendronephthya gigantea]|uniref:tetratricopeptide repeat protein 1-like n=1 Tax=Dendronephthya gigantea TaxID=151771 RepID=UPI00106B97A1|nr:tetratricopeptide repeat protein 1-like [Dendronephthya gigantea]